MTCHIVKTHHIKASATIAGKTKKIEPIPHPERLLLAERGVLIGAENCWFSRLLRAFRRDEGTLVEWI